jgi:hypothetical protein
MENDYSTWLSAALAAATATTTTSAQLPCITASFQGLYSETDYNQWSIWISEGGTITCEQQWGSSVNVDWQVDSADCKSGYSLGIEVDWDVEEAALSNTAYLNYDSPNIVGEYDFTIPKTKTTQGLICGMFGNRPLPISLLEAQSTDYAQTLTIPTWAFVLSTRT